MKITQGSGEAAALCYFFLPWGAGPGSIRASGSHAMFEHPPRT